MGNQQTAARLARRLVGDVGDILEVNTESVDYRAFVCEECGQPHSVHKTHPVEKRNPVRARLIAEMTSTDDKELLEDYARKAGFKGWTEYCRHLASKERAIQACEQAGVA